MLFLVSGNLSWCLTKDFIRTVQVTQSINYIFAFCAPMFSVHNVSLCLSVCSHLQKLVPPLLILNFFCKRHHYSLHHLSSLDFFKWTLFFYLSAWPNFELKKQTKQPDGLTFPSRIYWYTEESMAGPMTRCPRFQTQIITSPLPCFINHQSIKTLFV